MDSGAYLLAILCSVLTPGAIYTAEQRPLWLAVSRAGLVKAIEPLAAKRRADGFEVRISTKSIEEAIAESPRRPAFLLLVGDDEPGQSHSPWYLPAKRVELYRWRLAQRREYASDAAWGDLHGRGVPEIAVGRIPARSRAQAESRIHKILAFEAQPLKAADLQVQAWFGSPEYGAAIDAMASALGVEIVQTSGPPWARFWLVSGNPKDSFCGWPPEQPGRFTRQIKEGGLLSVLIGHAGAESFYSMYFAGATIDYTLQAVAGTMDNGPPAPPMVIISCYAGDFTRPTPCLSKSLFSLPGGPVAVIAATTESHPLTNYFTSVALLKALGGRERRIGALWLNAQCEARRARDVVIEIALRDVEGTLEPDFNIERLRRDQVLMYALLGDPATPLRLPEPLEARVQRTAAGWNWQVKRPKDATHLDVGYRQSHVLSIAPPEKQKDAIKARAIFEAANAAFAFSPLPSPPNDGPWEGTIDRPGCLRLIATAPKTLYVVALKLQ